MQKEYSINERIKTVRLALRMGREEFAQKTGINKLTLRNIEQGKQKPYAWHLEAIADLNPQLGFWVLTEIMLDPGRNFTLPPEVLEYTQELIKMDKTGVKSDRIRRMENLIREDNEKLKRILEEEEKEEQE